MQVLDSRKRRELFCSGNHIVLKATCSVKITTPLAVECAAPLENLARTREVPVAMVPEYFGTEGNEVVEELALWFIFLKRL